MKHPSRTLSAEDAALVKALLAAGWMQSDVASLLTVNIGRIAEINTGARFEEVAAADLTCAQTARHLQQIQTAWLLRIGGLLNETMKVAA